MTEITDNRKHLPLALERFVLHWGEMGGQWGVNRSVSQIHALLYLSERPLTAEEIADTLGLARSNVSNSIKELLGWNLIRRVPIRGDRRDHFEAETDIWRSFLRIAAGRKEREIDPAACGAAHLHRRADRDATVTPVARERLKDMLAFIEMMERWYAQMLVGAEAADRDRDQARHQGAELLPGREEGVARDRAQAKSMVMRSQVAAFKVPLLAPGERALNSAICGSARCWVRPTGRSSPLADPPPFLQAPRWRQHRSLHRRGDRDADEPRRLVAGAGRAPDRRPAPALARRQHAERRDGDRGRGERRTALDAALRTAARLPAGRAFIEAFRRPDRARGICRLRRRHGAHDPTLRTSALVFRAAYYFLQISGFRLRLPAWLSPGSLVVTHAELGDGRFLFKLDIVHPRLGRLIQQTAAFTEAHP